MACRVSNGLQKAVMVSSGLQRTLTAGTHRPAENCDDIQWPADNCNGIQRLADMTWVSVTSSRPTACRRSAEPSSSLFPFLSCPAPYIRSASLVFFCPVRPGIGGIDAVCGFSSLGLPGRQFRAGGVDSRHRLLRHGKPERECGGDVSSSSRGHSPGERSAIRIGGG